MIGIVVVSHSEALAEAALGLALEMVPGQRPQIALAAGAGDGVIGTDAAKVADAIDQVATPEGVLVIMDLGSAVMSAELALEFRASTVPVVLSSGPFVEGLLAGVVAASGGASLDAVVAEVRGALGPKQEHLGEGDVAPAAPAPEPEPAADLKATLEILIPDGLHARPAALLVTTMSAFDATVRLTNPRTGKSGAANSMMGVLSLGARQGDTLDVSASGPQAAEALAKLTDLAATGFGEL